MPKQKKLLLLPKGHCRPRTRIGGSASTASAPPFVASLVFAVAAAVTAMLLLLIGGDGDGPVLVVVDAVLDTNLFNLMLRPQFQFLEAVNTVRARCDRFEFRKLSSANCRVRTSA